LLNMEVRNREDGSPLFSVRGSLREHLTQLGNPTIHLSMSHGRHNAVAFVIVESQLAAHNRNQSEPPMRFVRS
jgi:phosphopantetheinyl transferase (holo-ACP synthase)